MKIHLRNFFSFPLVFNIVMDFEINHVSARHLAWIVDCNCKGSGM